MTSLRLPVAVTLRPTTPADGAVLREIYASTRAEELDQVVWAPGQREAFLEMQFSAQDHEYRRVHPEGRFDVVEVDGAVAGRLYVGPLPGDLRIIDIALLPGYRGRGIGGALVVGLQDQARAEGRTVSIHVEVGNPARRLYERLGFEVAESLGLHLRMEWSP